MQISRERPEQAERRERVKALRQEEVFCVQRTAKPMRLEHSEQGKCGKRQGWREVGRDQITRGLARRSEKLGFYYK